LMRECSKFQAFRARAAAALKLGTLQNSAAGLPPAEAMGFYFFLYRGGRRDNRSLGREVAMYCPTRHATQTSDLRRVCRAFSWGRCPGAPTISGATRCCERLWALDRARRMHLPLVGRTGGRGLGKEGKLRRVCARARKPGFANRVGWTNRYGSGD